MRVTATRMVRTQLNFCLPLEREVIQAYFSMRHNSDNSNTLILLRFVGAALVCRFQSTWVPVVEVQVARLHSRGCRPDCQVDSIH
jgi:hypothetical protein